MMNLLAASGIAPRRSRTDSVHLMCRPSSSLSRPRPLSRDPASPMCDGAFDLQEIRGERRRVMDRPNALPWDRIPSYGSLTGDTVYIARRRSARDKRGIAGSIRSWRRRRGSSRGRTGRGAAQRPLGLLLPSKEPQQSRPGKTTLPHPESPRSASEMDKIWKRAGAAWRRTAKPQITCRHTAPRSTTASTIQPERWTCRASLSAAFRPPRGGAITLHMKAFSGKDPSPELARRRVTRRPLGAMETKWRVTPMASPSMAVTGVLAGGCRPAQRREAVGFSWARRGQREMTQTRAKPS